MDDEKRRLILKTAALTLAADDARLFSDTHPDCAEAVDYYNRALSDKKAATDEYERRFGVVCQGSAVKNGAERNSLPWPWQETV